MSCGGRVSVSVVIQGKILRFDQVKGYGFIAPTGGGEDVFLHVNDLLDEKYLIEPGAVVEFIVEQGERGPKACSAHLVTPRSKPATPGPGENATPALGGVNARPVDHDGDDFVDVLSEREVRQEITERLLSLEPSLTGAQILAIREMVVSYCASHDWVSNGGL